MQQKQNQESSTRIKRESREAKENETRTKRINRECKAYQQNQQRMKSVPRELIENEQFDSGNMKIMTNCISKFY